MILEEDKLDTPVDQIWKSYVAGGRKDQDEFDYLFRTYYPRVANLITPFDLAGFHFGVDEIHTFDEAAVASHIICFKPSDVDDFADLIVPIANDANLHPVWHRYQESRDTPYELTWEEAISEHWIDMVHTVARSYARTNPYVDYMDVVAPAFFGLVDAVKDFDYTRGTLFTTYAGKKMRWAISDEIREYDLIGRVGRDRGKRYKDMHWNATIHQANHPEDWRPIEEIMLDMTEIKLAEFERTESDAHLMVDALSLHESIDRLLFGRRWRRSNILHDIYTSSKVGHIDSIQVQDIRYFADLTDWGGSDEHAYIAELFFLGQKSMREVGNMTGLGESMISRIITNFLKYLFTVFANDENQDAINYYCRLRGVDSLNELIDLLDHQSLATTIQKQYANVDVGLRGEIEARRIGL